MSRTVFISDGLSRLFPQVNSCIRSSLKSVGVAVATVGGTDNIWIRDWSAIPTAIGPVRFRYDLPSRSTWNILDISSAEMWKFNAGRVPIFLDGGNVVQNDKFAIVTEAVFTNNPTLSRPTLIRILESLLGKHLIIIPVEPGDTLGHSDGIVAFTDNGSVLLNNYAAEEVAEMDAYERTIRQTLATYGLETHPFPFAYYKCPDLGETEFRQKYPNADELNPCVGYYINGLFLPEIALVPQFGFTPEDEEAMEAATKHFPNREIHPIECHDLAMHGGVLHCVTSELCKP